MQILRDRPIDSSNSRRRTAFLFLTKHRLSGDSIYLSSPRSVEEYKALAASGAKWMNVRGDWPDVFDPSAIEQLRPTITAVVSFRCCALRCDMCIDMYCCIMLCALCLSVRRVSASLERRIDHLAACPSIILSLSSSWALPPAQIKSQR